MTPMVTTNNKHNHTLNQINIKPYTRATYLSSFYPIHYVCFQQKMQGILEEKKKK